MLKHRQRKPPLELLALFLGGLGLFLILAQGQIQAILGRLGVLLVEVGRNILRNMQSLSIFDAVGLVSIALGLALIAIRGWYRLRTEPRFTSLNCPRCGSRLRRSHRTRWDWILNRFVPVRRYKCRDRQCGWTGLRVKSLSSNKNTGSDFGSDSGEGIIGTHDLGDWANNEALTAQTLGAESLGTESLGAGSLGYSSRERRHSEEPIPLPHNSQGEEIDSLARSAKTPSNSPTNH